jgi:hypothetical protein
MDRGELTEVPRKSPGAQQERTTGIFRLLLSGFVWDISRNIMRHFLRKEKSRPPAMS